MVQPPRIATGVAWRPPRKLAIKHDNALYNDGFKTPEFERFDADYRGRAEVGPGRREMAL